MRREPRATPPSTVQRLRRPSTSDSTLLPEFPRFAGDTRHRPHRHSPTAHIPSPVALQRIGARPTKTARKKASVWLRRNRDRRT
eukprot:444253-Prymnesium_polylepis.1